MDEALLQAALDDARLFVSEDAPPMTDAAFETLAKDYQVYQGIIARLSTRYDRTLLESLLSSQRIDTETLTDTEGFTSWLSQLQEYLNARDSFGESFSVKRLEPDEAGYPGLVFTRLHHWIPETSYLSIGVFRSADYTRIATIGGKLNWLVEPGAYVSRGGKRKVIGSFGECLEWLIEEVRRGCHVQRYKGLGEMNPDQLWETTMNAETRRLLQVTIEDAIAADEVFTTLMGDQIEPRREFIERYALDAENVDI